MIFNAGSYALGFVAGALSILSPCVLPLVPILLTSAAQAHARGPLALAAGLSLSFALIGTAVAWAAANLGLDPTAFRIVGAVALAIVGVVLLSSGLQRRFSLASSGIGNAGQGVLSRLRLDDLRGQFVIGLVLGVVWSPCVGPTLGAAVLLASQGSQLPQIALLMAVFGLGAGLPLIALGLISRGAMMRMRGNLLAAGRTGKMVLGTAMLVVAALIVLGTDKTIETWLVDHSPMWLTDLTTRY
ncbi:MAG: cytochrome c biogenesis CcdA family protein [Burkholderiaceae bacterium]